MTVNEFGVIDEHKTFKGSNNGSDNLDRKEYFKKFGGDKIIAKVLLSWKKSLSMCVVIPHKMRNFNKCAKDLLCDGCDNIVNQKKRFFCKSK